MTITNRNIEDLMREIREQRFLLSKFKCPKCGEKELVADFEQNGADAVVAFYENSFRISGPSECGERLKIVRCENCGYESQTMDEIIEANKRS